MKAASLFIILLALGGCSSHPRMDEENSPCACYYNGKQLQTPTTKQLRTITEQVNEYGRA